MSDSEDKKVVVDAGLKMALKSIGHPEVPEKVSEKEFEDLTQKVSQGVRLRLQQKAREQNMIMLWKGRINLLRQGRQFMSQKSYAEAAVCYEKYLRVLELVFKLKKGQLHPGIFNKSARSKELTVITSVYWDLTRIYDTSKNYQGRMGIAAMKLAEFVPYSTLYPHIVKKAQAFQRTAKNPAIIKKLLKKIKGNRVGCFIATAVYDDYCHPDVELLRKFRDEKLQKSFLGQLFIKKYYAYSPGIAHFLNQHPRLKRQLRPLLSFFAQLL